MTEPLDYETLLEQSSNSTLAYLANRLTRAEKGTTWPSRQAAIRVILDVNDGLPDTDPRSSLLYAFFSIPPISEMRRRHNL